MFQSMRRFFGKQSTKRQPIVRRRFQLRVEELQARVLPSVTASVNAAHQLVIKGDDHANSVTVSLVDTSIHVAAGKRSFDFDSLNGNVVQIVFKGKGGRDVFVNNTAIPSVVDGGNGNDVLVGGAGDDSLKGGEGNDFIVGGSGDDRLLGSSGRDTLDGGDDDDFIVGGAGNDMEYGGNGNDIMFGGANDDSLHGDAGDDYENGGAGSDSLYGDDGDDQEHGGAGDDHLHGGIGIDHLNGGSGRDDAVGDDDDFQTEIEHEDFGAALTSSTAAFGFAEFYTTLHEGHNFEVEVENGPANQTLDVFVDGTKVGTLSTDHEGEGKLTLNLTTPTVTAGTTVEVKDSLGVLLLNGAFGQAKDD